MPETTIEDLLFTLRATLANLAIEPLDLATLAEACTPAADALRELLAALAARRPAERYVWLENMLAGLDAQALLDLDAVRQDLNALEDALAAEAADA